MLRTTILAALATAGLATAANAQVTLAGFINVDDRFTASVSTSATTAGTTWFSGTSWPTTYSGTLDITDPGTYFLHVRAQDLGRPEMFIGRFTLTGAGVFANGTQTLITNELDWVVSTSNFGESTTAPIVIGSNGISPWGFFANQQDAKFIWAPQYVDGVAYFTASFTVIPTPASAAAGLLGLAALRRKR